MAIAVLLFVFLRRALDVALVMAPLLLSALMTVVILVAAHIGQLNFANIIALPLLLGVGVSFNIYFVMNWRAGLQSVSGVGHGACGDLLRLHHRHGIRVAGFVARHPGTASMGALLLISLGCTLLASLVFLPTLLIGLQPR